MDINKRIIELENELAILPQGSINIKKINGKEQGLCQRMYRTVLQGML